MIILKRLYFRSIFYSYRTYTTTTKTKINTFNIEYDPIKQSIVYPQELILNNKNYPTDSWTNVTEHI
ncbi:unnamed protein product, partial [Rotaria sp. Silwood1]